MLHGGFKTGGKGWIWIFICKRAQLLRRRLPWSKASKGNSTKKKKKEKQGQGILGLVRHLYLYPNPPSPQPQALAHGISQN